MNFSSKDGGPITITAAVRTGALIIEENGLFPITSKGWRTRPAHQRTMTDFKNHFRQADKEYRRETTTTQAGYHVANDAYQPNSLTIDQDIESLALSNALFKMTPATFAAAVAESSTVTSQVTNPVPTFTPANFTATVLAVVADAYGGKNQPQPQPHHQQ